jgi:DNA-binding transcriptional ArsR family regulator
MSAPVSVQRERLITVFDALGDSTRLTILELILDQGEVACSELDDLLGLAKSTISYHTKILNAAGLIQTRRDGRFFHYRPTPFAKESVPALQELIVRFLPHEPPDGESWNKTA